MATVHAQNFDQLDARTWHDIVRLRIDVFVVEQTCVYAELDGRDTEPDTHHLWIVEAGHIGAYLRILAESNGSQRIGRVVTAPIHRGRGLAKQLMEAALELCSGVVVLDAQSHLVDWYAALGFSPTGEEFIEDGIPHVPMARPAE